MSSLPLQGKRILVTGGTGSLGKTLISRIVSGELGVPAKILVFSRDEAKQHFMRVQWQCQAPVPVTDEIIYRDSRQKLEFRVGDVRDYFAVDRVLRNVDYVFNAAAMKQVPTCEYSPIEAVSTNILGAENIVRAIEAHGLPVEKVVGISTDKACKPVNVMGMTKALQERIFIQANQRSPATHYLCVRYGNVLASRGSVIPLFHEQIKRGGPVTLTTPEMTRFFLSLNDAVDTIFAALTEGRPGETYIPRAPSALVSNVARALIGTRDIETTYIGVRPGEKTHEILVSEEEVQRTFRRGNYYVISSVLPELRDPVTGFAIDKEFSSADNVMSYEETAVLLQRQHLTVDEWNSPALEMLA